MATHIIIICLWQINNYFASLLIELTALFGAALLFISCRLHKRSNTLHEDADVVWRNRSHTTKE